MQLTPPVKLGSFPPADGPSKFSVQFQPNLWKDSTVPIDVSDRPTDEGRTAPSTARSLRRARSADGPTPRPATMKERALQEMRRNKLKEREKAMMEKNLHESVDMTDAEPPGKYKFQPVFSSSVVFDARDCARCHKSLKSQRQSRWACEDQDQEVEASPRRLCKGMHMPARSASAASSVGLKLREKMKQELLHRYSGSLDWDRASHASCNSMRELILTHGHATEVPDPLRQLEPAGKVNAWLSRG